MAQCALNLDSWSSNFAQNRCFVTNVRGEFELVIHAISDVEFFACADPLEPDITRPVSVLALFASRTF